MNGECDAYYKCTYSSVCLSVLKCSFKIEFPVLMLVLTFSFIFFLTIRLILEYWGTKILRYMNIEALEY